MKTKLFTSLALFALMVTAFHVSPVIAADEAAPARAISSDTKAAKEKPEKPVEVKAGKKFETHTEAASLKKEKVIEPSEIKMENPTAETVAPETARPEVTATGQDKAEEIPENRETSAGQQPASVSSAAPLPQAAPPRGLMQKFRSFFAPKASPSPTVARPVAPVDAPATSSSITKTETVSLSSPPTGTATPSEAKALPQAKGQSAGPSPVFVPPPLPMPPSLADPLAPPPVTPAVKAPDPPNLKQAEKVAKLFDLKQRLQGPLGPVTMLMMMEVDQANPGQMAMTQKAIAEAQAQFAADHEQEMREDTARFYAETFTADELQNLKEFYESSAGQKLMKAGDELHRRQSMFGNEVAMKNVGALREEVLKAIKKYDLKPPKPHAPPSRASEPSEARK